MLSAVNGKRTAITRIAVRAHCPIEDLLKPSQHYRIEEFKGGPQLVRHYAKRRQSLTTNMGFSILIKTYGV